MKFLLNASIDHARLGGADNIEAAQTVALFLYETMLGHSAGAAELHTLRQHIAAELGGTGLI